MSVNVFLTNAEQTVLENAKIGIGGAGGLGSNCAMHLVRSGIKNLVIADFDIVTESNLNRQFFFRDQIGQKKVEALAGNLRRIEPDLNLELHDQRLDEKNIPEIFKHCTIVVEAFDHALVKGMFISTMLGEGKTTIVSVSGIAGWGNSGEIKVHQIGRNLILIGDLSSGVEEKCFPFAPRVGIAAAMEANTVIAKLLNQPL